MDNASLDVEVSRRNHCVLRLRNSDMGEAATNKLMELLSDNPDILDEGLTPTQADGTPFEIREYSQRGMVILQTRVASVEMSDVMAARLRSLYVTHSPVALLTPRYLSDFSRAAFLLLYRYSYVDPGFRRQGYLAPRYFEAISRAFGRPIDLEAFVAAFNTTVPYYCSLFPDVEGAFGSQGSFFDLENVEDIKLMQVSPPRIGAITVQAVEHCANLLKKSEGELNIVLLTPFAWADVSRQIEDTGFSVWHNNVKRGDTIEYHDVVMNASSRYPMPRVTILSKQEISDARSRYLHSVFSSSR